MTLTLVAALTLSPFHFHAESIEHGGWAPVGKVGAIVAEAWQESDKQRKERERHEADLKADVELGKKYAAEVEKELKISKNQTYIDRVNRVAAELIPIANSKLVKVNWGDSRLNKYEYNFKVVENKQVNAFSLPGGFIFVYEGLVQYAESDDELAGVLAHEIAHASFRHVATLQKEASKLQLVQLPAILIAILSGGQAGADVLILSQLVGQASGSGWGQKAELAADYGSFQYIQHSKYSPVGMLTFIERLGRDQRTMESIDWGIYRTHPPSRERAESLTKYFNAANIPIRRSQVSTSARTTLREKEDGTAEIIFDKSPIYTFGGEIAKSRAEAAVGRLNEFFDSVPDLYEVTVTPDGAIRGRREILFRITEDDAIAAKKSVRDLSAEALKNMKKTLFMLAYRIWDSR